MMLRNGSSGEHLPTLKVASARRYGVSLDWLADEFEGKFLDQIGPAELAEFERKRRASGTSPRRSGAISPA
jgi:hypothetical protein